jgi:hypothetical protein
MHDRIVISRQIYNVLIEPVCPYLLTCGCGDQLYPYPHFIAKLCQCTFYRISDSEFLADPLDVYWSIAFNETRSVRDRQYPRYLCKFDSQIMSYGVS